MSTLTARFSGRQSHAVVDDDSLVRLRSSVGVAVIAATVLASGVASYDAYVVNVAVPAIDRRFGASVEAIQWTLTTYLLSVAALLLVAGALADHFGRRRVLAAGLGVMFIGSILCAAAPSISTLISARAVQGVGAGLVVPASLRPVERSARRADEPRAVERHSSRLRPRARHRHLGGTLDPRNDRWAVRRRLAHRSRVLPLGSPSQPSARRPRSACVALFARDECLVSASSPWSFRRTFWRLR